MKEESREESMCKAVSPAAFLALTFTALKTDRIHYSMLDGYRSLLRRQKTTRGNVPYDVAWNHDSYNFTMGFYSPVFKEFDDSGIECNRERLKHFYDTLTADIPQDDKERLQNSFSEYHASPGQSEREVGHAV